MSLHLMMGFKSLTATELAGGKKSCVDGRLAGTKWNSQNKLDFQKTISTYICLSPPPTSTLHVIYADSDVQKDLPLWSFLYPCTCTLREVQEEFWQELREQQGQLLPQTKKVI